MAQTNLVSASVRAVRSANKFIPRRAAINLSEGAVQQVRRLLRKRPDSIGVRIGVRTRGCNGLSYTLEYAEQKGKFDEEVIQDGVTVLIDSKAQLTLLGTQMDFVENELASEFIFHNPNIKGVCGCGESFSV